MKIARAELEGMIWDALAAIPQTFRRRMDNVVVTLEDAPPGHVHRDLQLRPDQDLLGLYQGVPYTKRGADYGNVLPDKITLYQENLTRQARDREALRREVYRTVWHEVGHYFGLSDRELYRLEAEADAAERRKEDRG